MTDPTLTCPSCRTEIKLTESLAAPLIADTRGRYEIQLAQKEAEVVVREAAIRDQQEQVASARQAGNGLPSPALHEGSNCATDDAFTPNKAHQPLLTARTSGKRRTSSTKRTSKGELLSRLHARASDTGIFKSTTDRMATV
jgi:hypothetical protein